MAPAWGGFLQVALASVGVEEHLSPMSALPVAASAAAMPMVNIAAAASAEGTQRRGIFSTILGMAKPSDAGKQGEATSGTDGATQATLGAEGVASGPPKPAKIILGSVLRGAMSGASVVWSFNWAAGKFGVKLPILMKLLTKFVHFVPFISKSVPMATLTALGVGAAIGAVFGLLGGIRKARKAAAEYAAKAAEQPPADAAGAPGQPVIVDASGNQVPVDPATGIPQGTPASSPSPPAQPSGSVPTNPVMKPTTARPKKRASAHPVKGSASARGVQGKRRARGYRVRAGDTLQQLARRWGCTVAAIRTANPAIAGPGIRVGSVLRIPT